MSSLIHSTAKPHKSAATAHARGGHAPHISRTISAFLLVVILFLGPKWALAQENEQLSTPPPVQRSARLPVADSWPLTLQEPGMRVQLASPSYEAWDYLRATIHIPVRVEPNGEAPILGTAVAEVRTFAYRSTQRLLLRDFSVKRFEISRETQRSATGAASPESIAETLTRLLSKAEVESPLDDIVRALVGRKPLHSISIAPDAPRVYASTRPAILVQFDGPPMWLPVDDTKISQGVNTNWDVFYDNRSTFYYLLAGDLWLATHDLYDGEWVIPRTLPKDLKRLPHGPDYAMVWNNLPYKPDPDREVPRVYFTERSAELILVDGEPQLEPIPGTPLAWVANSESDLFFHQEEKRYFAVIAGRWFSAARLEDHWRNDPEPPAAFARMPESHPRSHILAHVPGTPTARYEALWAQVPQLARVLRSEASISVAFAGRPQYTPIDGTSILWVPNATLPVLSHGQSLYACQHAIWFRADNPEGPWEVAESLPPDLYRIPSRSPAFHLSFVRLVESDDTSVTFGYTAGYKNTFVHNEAVVYGTGFNHPPALQYGAYTYPVYFAQPSTFGAGAWYDLENHVFLRGRPGYGPYGGFGATGRYNSVTSHYFRPPGLFGSENSEKPELAFYPYTGVFGRVSIQYDPYATWGTAIVPWESSKARGSRRTPTPVRVKAGTPIISAPSNAPRDNGMPGQRLKP